MNTGIIRRIDNLGRIVIPREMRRSLNINDGDPLEISRSGKNIILERYSNFTILQAQTDTFLKVMSKELKVPAVICDLDTVVSCWGTIPLKGLSISPGVQCFIRRQHSYHYEEHLTLDLMDSEAFLINALYPIGTLAEPVGALILLRNADENITPEQDKAAKTIALTLSELTKK